MQKKFFLIDGHHLCYQAYYGLPGLTTPSGQPIGAVYGFITVLRKILREKNPDYLMVAFDEAAPTFRHKEYAEYKGTRKPMPDDLVSQLPILREALKAHNVTFYSKEGFEADDLLGTLATRAAAKGIDAFIVTNDKDMQQLLDNHIFMYNSRTDEIRDVAWLKEEMNITPDQMRDLLGLAGDSSDNVPGVPGIGPKTALQLLHEWGDLEGVLNNVDKISGKKRQQNLREHADDARLSKRLVTIDKEVPLEMDLNACRTREMDRKAVVNLYERLGFRKLLSQLEGGEEKEQEEQESQESSYHLVNTPKLFRDFVKKLAQQRRFSFDLETTSVNAVEADIVGLSFAWKEREAYYVPVQAPLGQKCLNIKDVLKAIDSILEDEKIEKVGQNLKYDNVVLRGYGIHLRGIAFDTMLASYLLDATKRRHNMDALAIEFLTYKKIPISDLIGSGKSQGTMATVELAAICDYACEDADIALRLTAVLGPMLEEKGLTTLFQEIETPLVDVLAEMEFNGIAVDTEVLSRMSNELGDRLIELEQEIYQLADCRFNIQSPKQLSEVLFEKLNLPAERRTKTGYSTDANVLATLSQMHPLPGLLIEYRQLIKLKSTYLDQLQTMVSKKTGKIHASFNQAVTATGRLSSSNPNLQNIPVRTELGRRIREAFVASMPDHVLMTVDYSQVELRILAHLSEDPALLDAFENDRDIHSFVAAQIYDVKLDDVTSDMRRRAKAVNFGIIYGQTAYGLSKELGIPVGQAQDFINAYFNRYKKVKEFIDSTVKEAEQKGYVTTIRNRRRDVLELTSDHKQRRAFGERTAVNTVIQGSAADLIKIAMNNIYSKLQRPGYSAKLLLQIHDELVFEVPEKDLEKEKRMILDEMVSAMDLKVPLKVSAKAGKNWLEAD